MADLDHRHPIIFFPIRLETKYDNSTDGGLKLRVRFYPDQITISNFDPRLTRREVEDARDYWKAVGNGTEHRNSAWIKLANQYGLPRAAYISKAVIIYDPDLEADPVSPSLKADNEIPPREENDNLAASCEMLPRRFRVYGKFKDPKDNQPELEPIEGSGNIIPESLQLPSLQNIGTKEADWVSNFQVALEKGMAIEINLTEEQYKRGFDYIIAYGIRDTLNPEGTKTKIENLFNAHRYSHGLKLVKQGTPTNLIKETSKEVQSFFSPHHPTQSDSITYRSVEFGALDKGGPDGRALERALGLDNIASGLLNANNYDQLTAACMSSALWPSVLGYFIDKFANIQSLNPENLQNHFLRYVSAQGVVPPICVGKTPYGILPVTIFSKWEDQSLLGGTEHIRTFFDRLRIRWNRFVNKVPTVMDIDITENLLDILSMEAFSYTYNVRGFRSLNYIADCIFEILKKTSNGKKIVASDLIVKNKLLLNILLKLTFPSIPDGALKGFYEQCAGSGISEIKYHMVSESEKEDDLPPPDYIEKIYNDVKGSDRNFLKTTKEQMEIAETKPSNSDPLLLRLLRFSASLLGQKNDEEETKKFIDSLEILREINSDRLKTLMLQTLDLVSYRLDAWITSFANQRLDHLRSTTGDGLYAGAFGWIENLMPANLQSVPEGGYIQAPSYVHAAASAVLRNSYMTHSDEQEKKDLLKININSERTKNALEIINGIRNTPMPELLGYMLERRLHDAKIDYLIDEFRKHFPLNKDDSMKLDDVKQGEERIEPRNLTDGLVVFKNWKRLIDGIAPELRDAVHIIEKMEEDDHVPGWKSFYSEIRAKYAVQDEMIIRLINQLKPELYFLLDQMDGVSDLCLAESVFQAVSGNFSRSGAVLEGMSADGQIPTPEISTIPRSGSRQIQRIALAFEVQPFGNLSLQDVDDTFPWTNPRRLAEPNINKLTESYIGTILFWIDLKDLSGNVTSTEEVSLTELGLEPIDLIYIENSELEHRLNYYAKSRGLNNYDIRYERKDSTPEQIEKRSLVDLQFLIKALREMMAQGHPLNFSDFQHPNETDQKKLVLQRIKEIFQRYYNTILLLVQTLEELQRAMDDETDLGIEKKIQALIKAGFFESEFAVPLTPEGNIINSVEILDMKIEVAITKLKSRLPQTDEQREKILEWKSRLETQGEEPFLESLVDELSGEPQNAKKYLKTIDILVEQVRRILNSNSFIILPTFTVPSDKLKSSSEINSKVLKWISKTSYVRPRMKLLDEIITYNQILESSNFSFYCDETKFMKGARTLENEKGEEVNPVSLIVTLSIRNDVGNISEPLQNLTGVAGVVIDDCTDKIVSEQQHTHIAFHYNGPNSEAPQCLLLAVSPNDHHTWDGPSMRRVISDTLALTKLRAVDYRSVKELRQFLPTMLLNSHGEDIFINLFEGDIS